jgi:hypothetical protein
MGCGTSSLRTGVTTTQEPPLVAATSGIVAKNFASSDPSGNKSIFGTSSQKPAGYLLGDLILGDSSPLDGLCT